MKPTNQRISNLVNLQSTSDTLYSTTKLRRKVRLSKHVSLHVSEVSAVMVGICQAGVGLIHIANVVGKIDTYIDDLLALDSLIFTTACFTAFWAFRSTSIRKTLRLGYISEGCFVIGLCVIALVSLLTAYSSIKA